ncbi:hypothetical protein [Streptomyces sp. I05A-00742]|uniref:hypothetical protein n=1 Tax=Streptomyces sp. I05A-00742 TaxID=2732853 RepID=UPI001488F05B|nr:hypothetical protein [Streptomyces sp. I05A-00742]
MKIRHVRAAAVFGIVVVTLTGARGHHGGSCGGGGSSHSSSSSSSGGSTTTSGGTTGGDSTVGSTTSGGTTDGTTTGGFTTSGTSGSTTTTTTTGGSSTYGSTGGSSSRNSAMRDIRIAGCDYSDRLGITAKITATNSSTSLTYNYRFTVNFTVPDGTRTTRQRSILFVGPGKTGNADVSTPYVPKPGAPTGRGRCEVTNVVRTSN